MTGWRGSRFVILNSSLRARQRRRLISSASVVRQLWGDGAAISWVDSTDMMRRISNPRSRATESYWRLSTGYSPPRDLLLFFAPLCHPNYRKALRGRSSEDEPKRRPQRSDPLSACAHETSNCEARLDMRPRPKRMTGVNARKKHPCLKPVVFRTVRPCVRPPTDGVFQNLASSPLLIAGTP
jgi:hypothetical protein